jgi:hypothetical protein
MKVTRVVSLIVASLLVFSLPAKAVLYLEGPTSNARDYTIAELQAKATPTTTVTNGALTGISLWGLLGTVTTTIPPMGNTNNPLLRYYVGGVGADGRTSVISVGEINPGFGGTTNPNLGSTPLQPFVAFQKADGTPLVTPQLVFPTAPGRGLSDLAGLQLLAVPGALNMPGAGQSASLVLSGNVTNPGTYDLTRLKSEFTSATETFRQTPANTGAIVTYTGVPLWAFLNPLPGDSLNKLVVVTASDGYRLVFSLAEFDPALGGDNPISHLLDLLAYEGTSFPNSGFARIVLPEDNMRGRWNSNIVSIAVIDAPLITPIPAALPLFATGLIGLGFFARTRKRKEVA